MPLLLLGVVGAFLFNMAKPCNGKYGTCKNTVSQYEKYCPTCLPKEKARQKRKNKEYDTNRGSSYERGYDLAWRKLRAYKLKVSPLCECPECEAGEKKVRSATMVHHIIPVEEAPHLRLEMANLLSMTRECHERIHGRKL